MTGLAVRAGPVTALIERRTFWAATALALAALFLGFVALSYGARWTAPVDVLRGLVGDGPSALVVREWRAPRVLAALVFGASLGVAGALFQNLTRNPLGSPDVIGLDEGAYTGALIAITVLGGTSVTLATASVLGGLITAAAVYLLAHRGGFSGLRLVVIGVGVNAMLIAFNAWIILRAELEVAMAAAGWNAGSLNGVGWNEVLPAGAIVAGLFVAVGALARTVHQVALGDELAQTSGVSLAQYRPAVVVLGVGCSATVTAVAGPIIFVALAAPQIGRRICGAAGVALLPSALTGAVLLQGADLIAQLLLAPESLPVGVVTTVLGGCYLIWLLVREMRRRR